MALRIQSRSWKNRDGSISRSWRLIVDDYTGVKVKSFYPTKAEYVRYGLNPSDDLDTAKEKLKIARGKNRIEKREEKRAACVERLKLDKEVESAFLPAKLYAKFIPWLCAKRLWTAIPSKTESHLTCMRKLVREVKLEPSKWVDNPERIYVWFLTHSLSQSYIEKIIPLLNEYGFFYSRELGKTYLQIKSPRGDIARRIEEANYESRGGRTNESLPIVPKDLSRLKDLPEDQLRWIRLTIFFGLRPEEAINLTDANRNRTWKITTQKATPILNVYQSKLVKIDRKRRWKRIPCILKEQRALLEELKKGLPVKSIYPKVLQAHLGEGHYQYGGRKGFEKMMREHGQDFRNISRWLGHQDINRTEMNYRELEAVEFDPVE